MKKPLRLILNVRGPMPRPLIHGFLLAGEIKPVPCRRHRLEADPRPLCLRRDGRRLVPLQLPRRLGPGVGRRYDRHDYVREKKAALDAWDAKLRRIITGKKAAEYAVALRRKEAVPS